MVGDSIEFIENTPEQIVSSDSDHNIPKSNSSVSVLIPTFAPPAIYCFGDVIFPLSNISNIT